MALSLHRRNKCWPQYTWPAIIVASLLLSLWFIHSRALRLVQPARVQPQVNPADFDIIKWEDVTFLATDGVQLVGWFVPPASDSNGETLVFIHGLGSNRADLLNQAAMLATHGYGSLLFDLRAHGQSQGNQSTWGVTEMADIEGAITYLQKRPEVNSERLAFIGHSMGGAIALQATALFSEIQAVIVESSYTSFNDNAEHLTVSFARLPAYFAPIILPWAACAAGVRVDQIRPIDDVATIAPRPILFIHGQQDTTISYNNSERLYAAAKEPKVLYLVPNADHFDILSAAPATFEQEIVRFLDTYLRES